MEPNNYFLVDVFTQRAFGGNPLAVFPYAKEMTFFWTLRMTFPPTCGRMDLRELFTVYPMEGFIRLMYLTPVVPAPTMYWSPLFQVLT